ncbi:hypothetical protein ONE63_000922 [Megalurothrips usitatus]|uniref:Uncharacterized protein n=1 Tax=Megalurothrips usitatus TaxID=439358 RepID=A0AAV7Y002_9NEOP|nr:hypothetical protein ONE63_000922 [Megalurothrips usitatus]
MSFCPCECGAAAAASGLAGPHPRDYGAPTPKAWTKPLAPSTSWLVLSLALILGVVSWTSYNIYINAPDASDAELALLDVTSNSTTEKDLVGLFDTTSIAVIATVCVLQAAVSQHLVLRLVEQLRKVDALLPRAQHDVPRWLLVFFVCLSFVILVDVIFKLWIDSDYAVCTTPSYISYLITYGREAMFVDDVTSVRARFQTLNQELATVLPLFPSARGT